MNSEPTKRTPEQEEIENLKRYISRLEARIAELEGTTQLQKKQIQAHRANIPKQIIRR
ncbi:hypothetical protein [Desulfovibrio sp.]|uniref:hypothetical protein n=1 Tax=Desulfovibrio sp. TaxID=885 RepID=UPI0025C572F8|nr:hypothetical protein [Desulfovibrio sp.]